MTDIVGARVKIQAEEVDYRSAISETTFTKIGSSINWIIENTGFMVGDVVTSVLTVAQFQAERSSNWVLMDGASVVGSDYETITGNSNVPDIVTDQRFLRQTDVDGNLETLQASNNLSHNHQQRLDRDASNINSAVVDQDYNSGPDATPGLTWWGSGAAAVSRNSNSKTPVTTVNSGGSESRPNNMYVNYFLKINN